ncbi:MAG: hypothetical protein LUE06_08960 [Oscillospiraceae bacterium]|nr:hypothetical protein [Oscillospiraceae bacterium]
MADKELRKMSRTELIEIIYALQQNERSLREENEELRKQLDDKLLRIEKAGSIAEAALSLNHIFEDAEAAAQQYLASLQFSNENASKIVSIAQRRSETMISEAEERVKQTEEQCHAMLEKTEDAIQKKKDEFIRETKLTLEKYPELARRMRENGDN